VAWLLAQRHQWSQFRALSRDVTNVLASDFPGNVGDRYAGFFAALLVTATLATPVLGLPGDPETTVRSVMEGLSQPQEESDTALRALVDFLGWAISRQGLFEGREDPERPPLIYAGRWAQDQYIAVFPDQARRQLVRMGYDPEEVIRLWRGREWLKVDQDRLTHRMRILGVTHYMITLDWTAVMAAVAPEDLWVP
jgi:hypothetical protein